MRVHKRKKNSRIRGARTCGWGFRQKHKGHGNKGGFGMAGTGKRGDHKKQSAEQSVEGAYFGKQGATSRGTQRDKSEKINLKDIKANFFKKEGEKINFAKHKILGTGDGFKAEIIALSASASAIEKMNKAGGKITLPVAKVKVKQYVVKEKKVEEEGSEVEGGEIGVEKVEGKGKKKVEGEPKVVVKKEKKVSKEVVKGKVAKDKGKKKK